MLFNKISVADIVKRLLIAVASVSVASVLRLFFLSSLENKVVWITFYPAVMIAALLGGFFTGVLSASLACFVVLNYWYWFIPKPFINTHADWVGLSVFLFNCIFVSGIADYSQRQRKKAQQAKLLAEKALEEAQLANKAKSIFLANMSHELRTPLNAILGFTGILQRDNSLSEKDRKNIEIVNRSGEHLLNLINNVLDLSKIEAGKVSILKESFNLRKTLDEVVLGLHHRAEFKGLVLEYIPDGHLPEFILSDNLKIKQIIYNLLGNAIKFTEQGKITLKVSAEKGILAIKVEDTGVGIPAGELEKVFEPFHQSSGLASEKGTGLGLTITKEFAEFLGGGITAESTPGKGSSFTVTIKYEEGDTAPEIKDLYSNIIGLAAGEKNRVVLVADDQPDNRLLLKQILENAGFTAVEAVNGEEAIKVFTEKSPDLIFMDIRMPVMDGTEATKRIRLLPGGADVKIIGVSAHIFTAEINNVTEAGMNDFLKKPFKFSEIYEVIQKQLGIKYKYSGSNPAEDTESLQLTEEILMELDPADLNQLRDLIERLNIKALAEFAAHLQAQDKQAGPVIQNYLAHYRMTELFKQVKKVMI